MVKIVYQENNKRLECITRLMYESGLRAGEVLSLTLEDLLVSHDVKNNDVYQVILRNRVSNLSWQSPKYLMKTFSKEDYKTRDYQQRGYGYQVVHISKSLYELLVDYLDEAHSEQQIKHKKNWQEHTVADSVDRNFKEKVNFYIFVNSIGKPYSKKMLDIEVKRLFKKAGVKLNADGGKFDGLCHRFRHGFAMYQVNYNKVPMLLLMELMRHSSLDSTAIYYTPDTSTIIKIKDEMSKSMSELLPEFDIRKEKVNV
jgi:integrase/recombinase XerD